MEGGERGVDENVWLPERHIIVAEELSDQHPYDPLADCVCSFNVGRLIKNCDRRLEASLQHAEET